VLGGSLYEMFILARDDSAASAAAAAGLPVQSTMWKPLQHTALWPLLSIQGGNITTASCACIKVPHHPHLGPVGVLQVLALCFSVKLSWSVCVCWRSCQDAAALLLSLERACCTGRLCQGPCQGRAALWSSQSACACCSSSMVVIPSHSVTMKFLQDNDIHKFSKACSCCSTKS
jgi:hypothetical protein